jgi:hypothetical protein
MCGPREPSLPAHIGYRASVASGDTGGVTTRRASALSAICGVRKTSARRLAARPL